MLPDDVYMTKNFKLSELECPCCALFNMPEWMLGKIQRVRDDYGFPMKINSACRCVVKNKEVDGARNSRHLQGIAIDVKVIQGTLRKKLMRVAIDHGVMGIGIYKTFLHLDWGGVDTCWVD